MRRYFPVLYAVFVGLYAWYYAPYGVNETDGGFLSGLAWQLQNGKHLYVDIAYVRPPVPIWMRWLEMQVVPDSAAILAERWLFYIMVGMYSWLGAAILRRGAQTWPPALFSFLVSVHCFPANAWHTVDGIFWAVLAIYWLNKKTPAYAFWGAAALATAVLCKQSFYPLLALPFVFAAVQPRRSTAFMIAGLIAGFGAVFLALWETSAWSAFLHWTSGAAESGQALQHGVVDYFRIQPIVGAPVAIVLAGAWYIRYRKSDAPGAQKWLQVAYLFSMLWLIASYAWAICQRQEFTAPFAQTRLLFALALIWVLQKTGQSRQEIKAWIPFLALLLVSWCAAMSWGYNLPVLFSTPYIWVVLHMGSGLFDQGQIRKLGLAVFFALLLVFRLGYEFVYRDGRRSDMDRPLGKLFPALTGIYSSRETEALYADLLALSRKYPDFKTLPAFPNANYLARTYPPLPLDWVVRREMNGDTAFVRQKARAIQTVYLVQKSYGARIETDPELEFTRQILKNGRILEETPHFWVLQ